MSNTEVTPQEAAEKAAVIAMRNAQSNMDKVLRRVSTLEAELCVAKAALKNARGYVGEHAHTWPTDGAPTRRVHLVIDAAMARIDSVLS